MTELLVKVLVNSNLSVVTINSNCSNYYSHYKYLINNNSSILPILKRIVPKQEEIFNYQDLLFQVKNFYCKSKSMIINKEFKFSKNCNLVFDNIIQFPLNNKYLQYQEKPININLKTKDNYLEIIFGITLLSSNISNISTNSNITSNCNVNTINNKLLGMFKDQIHNSINNNYSSNSNNSNNSSYSNNGINNKYSLDLQDKVSNLKKVSIPNILSYIKYHFTSKYQIDKSNFEFCKGGNEIKDEYLQFVFIHYQWMDKIFNNITNYLKIKKYNITTFQYCLCQKYLKLTINLKRSKRTKEIISFRNSYYKPILDKYNIDLPRRNTSNYTTYHNNTSNTTNTNNNTNTSTKCVLMDNINDICKMMDISLQFCLKISKNNNINSNSNKLLMKTHSKTIYSKQLVIKIPLVKEVKPREINTVSYLYLQ